MIKSSITPYIIHFLAHLQEPVVTYGTLEIEPFFFGFAPKNSTIRLFPDGLKSAQLVGILYHSFK